MLRMGSMFRHGRQANRIPSKPDRTPRRRYLALALSILILWMISPYARAYLVGAAEDRKLLVIAVFGLWIGLIVLGSGWGLWSAIRRLRAVRRE